MQKNILTLTPLLNCNTDLLFQDAQLHQHIHWELTLFLSGTCVNTINNHDYNVSTGHLVILGPMHAHSIIASTLEHTHRDIYISDQELRNLCGMLFNDAFYQRLCDENNPIVFRLSDNMCQELNHMLECVEVAYMKSQNHDQIMPLINSIVIFILGQAFMQDITNKTGSSSWIIAQLTYLRQPKVFSQNIDDIIDSTGYSHSQYLRLFKQNTGVTLVKHLIDLRINHAKTLLLSSSKSVLDISCDVGYESVNYFIRTFKEHTGLTPLQYRLQQKNNPET